MHSYGAPAFLSRGQSSLQCPHCPWPLTWLPFLSVRVEHQAVPSCVWSKVHALCRLPSRVVKGKTQRAFLFAPLLALVLQGKPDVDCVMPTPLLLELVEEADLLLQLSPQWPHSPSPVTWFPPASVLVEHQSLPLGSFTFVHPSYVLPSYLLLHKGMHAH